MDYLLGLRPFMHTLVDCVGLAEPNLAWHYCALDNLECHPKDSDVSLSQEPNASSIPTAICSNSTYFYE